MCPVMAMRRLVSMTVVVTLLGVPAAAEPVPDQVPVAWVDEVVNRTVEYVDGFDPTSDPQNQWQYTQDYLMDIYDTIPGNILSTLCLRFQGSKQLDTGEITVNIKDVKIKVPGMGWEGGPLAPAFPETGFWMLEVNNQGALSCRNAWVGTINTHLVEVQDGVKWP